MDRFEDERSMTPDTYRLLDSGDGRKLEQFGDCILARPCAQAIWRPQHPELWNRADAVFDRKEGNHWQGRGNLPKRWVINAAGIRFQLSGTDFGHLGIFPEQRAQWRWIQKTIQSAASRYARPIEVLNLFAYSGGSTLAAALAGASVCHLDASRGMVQWARENAALNELAAHPIRWITDDAHKFLARELRRGRHYDAIILDPPTFGRGQNGEMYKIEADLPDTLEFCRKLLSDHPLFILLSAHTPGYTPIVLGNILAQATNTLKGRIETGEMLLDDGTGRAFALPSGVFARWTN